MLALTGLCIIIVMLAAILTKKLSALAALMLVPCAGALLMGFSPAEISRFIIDGLRNIVPAAGMFVFAILFFGVVSDAGMLDPIINWIIRKMGNYPARITMGTVLLTLIIHLDGSGAVTFMLTVPAILPIYERLGMDRRILALTIGMAAGVNVLPWVGPVIRASAVMQVPAATLFYPLIPVQIVGLGAVFLIAYMLGKREERRLGLGAYGANASAAGSPAGGEADLYAIPEEKMALRRPRMFWPNIILTLCVIITLVAGWVDAVVSFMIGTALALIINYPDVDMQKKRVDAHAKPALMMASILMAAGVFVGIMKGAGMLTAMAQAAVSAVPEAMGQHIPFALGIISMPLSLFFDPDSFYFGVMPVIAEVYGTLGGDPLEVARAALLGALTTGFPITPLTPAPFLLVALCRIDFGEHQKYCFPYLWLCTILMTVAAAAFGVIPW
ncbi:citrate:proton symporter [Desulfovibrio sp. OttesenSCG-928-I05]|nr:citrate:proton symporter [Desulfovibrio sp. OttesenSCG-928-I05]